MSDPAMALKEWVRVTRPGGRVVFTVPAPGAFEPMNSQLAARLAGEGLTVMTESEGHRLLTEAGLIEVTAQTESLGYHLKNANEWWELAWHSGLFPSLHELAPAALEALRLAHVAETERHQTGEGLRIEVRYLRVSGRKPG
jgi:SAM-dependent methyltransferase